jgi:glutamate formiminotransferase/formiminotetrahydrofolate cyclodeaminase
MRLLAITHWSFGRDRELLRSFRESLDLPAIDLHDLRADPDLNRTIVVFSAEHELVQSTITGLADHALPRIDLSRHTGTHERTGALDCCALVVPFRDPTRQELEVAHASADLLAAGIAAHHEVPVFLSDKAARRQEAEVLQIKEGGFGFLAERRLMPDFGPSQVHPQLGVSIIGVRDFYLTFQMDFEAPNGGFARTLEREARELRTAGDPQFLGTEPSSHLLASRNRARLFIELGLPDLASPDPIIEWALDRSARAGLRAYGAELVGAIRVGDLPGATRLSVRDPQILG